MVSLLYSRCVARYSDARRTRNPDLEVRMCQDSVSQQEYESMLGATRMQRYDYCMHKAVENSCIVYSLDEKACYIWPAEVFALNAIEALQLSGPCEHAGLEAFADEVLNLCAAEELDVLVFPVAGNRMDALRLSPGQVAEALGQCLEKD